MALIYERNFPIEYLPGLILVVVHTYWQAVEELLPAVVLAEVAPGAIPAVAGFQMDKATPAAVFLQDWFAQVLLELRLALRQGTVLTDDHSLEPALDPDFGFGFLPHFFGCKFAI